MSTINYQVPSFSDTPNIYIQATSFWLYLVDIYFIFIKSYIFKTIHLVVICNHFQSTFYKISKLITKIQILEPLESLIASCYTIWPLLHISEDNFIIHLNIALKRTDLFLVENQCIENNLQHCPKLQYIYIYWENYATPSICIHIKIFSPLNCIS